MTDESMEPELTETTEASEPTGSDEFVASTEFVALTEEEAIDLLEELDNGLDELPVEAMEDARRHREVMIPWLIDAIQNATEVTREGDPPDGMLNVYAWYLSAEFRAREALPAMLEQLQLPGELPFDLLGDSITEDCPRILASLIEDEFAPLQAMLRDQTLDRFVRSTIARVYLYLVRDGCMTREAAVAVLHEELRRAIEQNDADSAENMVIALTDYAAPETLEDVRQAFAKNMLGEFSISREHVEEDFAKGEVTFQAALKLLEPTGIDDAISFMESWAMFDERYQDKSDDDTTGGWTRSWEAFPDDEEVSDDEYDDDGVIPTIGWGTPDHPSEDQPGPAGAGTIRNAEPRVGRNAPCPCGSGKKFKKCCGGRRE